jgi:hypothetical protein
MTPSEQSVVLEVAEGPSMMAPALLEPSAKETWVACPTAILQLVVVVVGVLVLSVRIPPLRPWVALEGLADRTPSLALKHTTAVVVVAAVVPMTVQLRLVATVVVVPAPASGQ